MQIISAKKKIVSVHGLGFREFSLTVHSLLELLCNRNSGFEEVEEGFTAFGCKTLSLELGNQRKQSTEGFIEFFASSIEIWKQREGRHRRELIITVRGWAGWHQRREERKKGVSIFFCVGRQVVTIGSIEVKAREERDGGGKGDGSRRECGSSAGHQ